MDGNLLNEKTVIMVSYNVVGLYWWKTARENVIIKKLLSRIHYKYCKYTIRKLIFKCLFY